MEGDEEVNEASLEAQYRLSLLELTSIYDETVSGAELAHYDSMLRPITCGLGRHFKEDVAVRVRAMVIVGYVEHHINGVGREECVHQMGRYGWPNVDNTIAGVLYDVLMKAL